MLRRRSIACVALMLFVQLGANAAAAASLWRAPLPQAAEACRCPHGQAALVCPMHKAPAQQARCHLRSSHNDDAAVLGGVLGAIGVLPLVQHLATPAGAATPVRSVASAAASRVQPPDFPPPRV
jgi:hypothetical protein